MGRHEGARTAGEAVIIAAAIVLDDKLQFITV